MKDRQLRRCLEFRSACRIGDFVDRSAPSGVDLDCPDRIDEWICRSLLDFKNGDMLHEKGNER